MLQKSLCTNPTLLSKGWQSTLGEPTYSPSLHSLLIGHLIARNLDNVLIYKRHAHLHAVSAK